MNDKQHDSRSADHPTLTVRWASELKTLGDLQLLAIELRDVNNRALASLLAPSELMLNAIALEFGYQAVLTPDGRISILVTGNSEPLQCSKSIDLGALLARTVSTDMMEDEPEAEQLLSIFRARLLKSIKMVDHAINLLAKS